MSSPEESLRLAHYAACQAEAAAAVPAPPREVSVPDHSAEIRTAHQGTVLSSHFSVIGEAQ